MSAIVPLHGAPIVRFDHATAEVAINQLGLIRDRLIALRLDEAQRATGARINWHGPSRRRFEQERGRLGADLDRSITGLSTLIDRLRAQQARAGFLQAEANAAEQRARARDVERLAERAERGA